MKFHTLHATATSIPLCPLNPPPCCPVADAPALLQSRRSHCLPTPSSVPAGVWPQGGRECSGHTRGEEAGAIQQGAVVVVADKVAVAGGDIAALGPEHGLDLHRVLRVVEVDDVDIKDEHG